MDKCFGRKYYVGKEKLYLGKIRWMKLVSTLGKLEPLKVCYKKFQPTTFNLHLIKTSKYNFGSDKLIVKPQLNRLH